MPWLMVLLYSNRKQTEAKSRDKSGFERVTNETPVAPSYKNEGPIGFMDIRVAVIIPSNKVSICTGNWEIDKYMYVQEEVREGERGKCDWISVYETVSENMWIYRPLYSSLSSYTFRDQMTSTNTAKQQSHFVLKLLLIWMKNTICNQIRWQSVISSLPHTSKEQYTYFSLWLLRYSSS